MRVLRDIFVLSVSGGPRAQELQSMMFNLKNRDLFCVPERGKDLGGFPKTDGLESRGSDP